MNSEIMNGGETNLLSYRFRTARQKKRMLYEDFEKFLRRKYREDQALWHTRHELGYQPLTPPVQQGWTRTFILREDVARSESASFFQGILDKINTRDWSHRKDFRIKLKTRKNGRKQYGTKELPVRRLAAWEWKKLKFSEKEARYFERHLYYDRNWEVQVCYVFREPWRFVLKVRPNMIEKVKLIYGDMETAITKVNHYLERIGYRSRQWRIIKGHTQQSGREKGDKYDEKNPLKNKPLQQILEELKDEYAR